MFQSSMPLRYWGECVLTATYLINRMPTKVLKGKTPFEVLFGQAPTYTHLRVFGCLCFMTTSKHGRDKFQDRAKACVFMGYPFGKKGYRVLELATSKFHESRDVVFHENIFPFVDSAQDTNNPFILAPSQKDSIDDDDTERVIKEDEATNPERPMTAEIIQPYRRSTRQHTMPRYLNDYVCCNDVQNSTCCCTLTNLSMHPKVAYGATVMTNPHSIVEPKSYWEAASNPGWKEAMDKELEALNVNNTWEIVSLPSGKRPIDCKWVYKAKCKANGSLERLKARLVVRGFTQKEGIDYTETFSPVVRLTTVRVLMAVAVKKGWLMHQLDVNNAFLHGDLHEEIYMNLPQGVSSTIPNAVCKLNKSLYGLKQASRQWYAKLTTVLYARGYQHSSNDYSLFHKKTANSSVFLGVYVDDIILTGNDEVEIQALKQYLDEVFKIKDLSLVHYFLGIEVLQVDEGIILTQRKFAKELLQEFAFDNLCPVSCPLDLSRKLTLEEAEPLDDPTSYRRGIGKLNFLTNTGPDLAFAVQHLSQFMQRPRVPHYNALMHVLRYIKGQLDFGVLLHNKADYTLQAYCDSDWASCPHTRRSISGYVIFLGGSLISWKSKKQGTVSLSSAEAEYRSMRRVVAELSWLSRLLNELTITSITPIPIRCDNQAAVYIAKNPVFHERTKHIELDCHFVREKLMTGLISLQHIPLQQQLADVLTKPLSGPLHRHLVSKLGVLAPTNLRGALGIISLNLFLEGLVKQITCAVIVCYNKLWP